MTRLSLAVLVLQVPGFACGKERWPVKAANDADSTRRSLSTVPSTVNQLSLIPAPINPNIKPNNREFETADTIRLCLDGKS